MEQHKSLAVPGFTRKYNVTTLAREVVERLEPGLEAQADRAI
jgi:hypothetical protein